MKGKTGMASLPEELLYEILLLVPPAQLNELKFVCKCWFRLTNSPDFAESNLRRGMSQCGIVCTVLDGPDVYYLSFDNIDSNEIRTRKLGLADCLRDNHQVTHFRVNYQVFDSFRGLLVVGIRLWATYCLSHFLVWNPVTGSSMLVPACCNRQPLWDYRVHITYDPSVHRYKLIWTSNTTEFRSVLEGYVIELVGGKQLSSSWKNLTMPLEAGEGKVRSSLLNEGKIHWLMQMKDRCQQLRLWTLDLSTEMFKVVDCSPTAFPLDSLSYFLPFNGTFYGLSHGCCPNGFKQWMLEDFEKPKWSMHPLVIIPPPRLNDVLFLPLAVLDKGSKVVFLSLLKWESAVYELASATWRLIPFPGERIAYWLPVGHSDSLVNPMR